MINGSDRLDVLRTTLEQQYDRHTEELTRLTVNRVDPERDGLDRATVPTLIASTRQALSDTAEALRRMAEGRYGTCERCRADIPVERLEILPHTRYCVPCQQVAAAT